MKEPKEKLLKKFKNELVEQISVAGVKVDEIQNDEPIFGDEGQLQLDSLDALELVLLLEKNFDIKIKGRASTTVIFQNFNALGDYILENANQEMLNHYIENEG